MCDPVTAAVVGGGLLASAGGSYMQAKDQNKTMKLQQWAKEDAYKKGMGRQKAFAEQAGSQLQPMVQNQGANAFQNKLAENTAQRLQAFKDNSIDNPDYSVPGSTPKNVALAMEKAYGESDEKADRDQSGLARIAGYGDAQFGQGLARNDFARAFGNLSDKASRDASLMGMDMNTAAFNANRGASIWPTLLKTAGQAATMYGSAGMPGMGAPGSAFGTQGGISRTMAFGTPNGVGPIQSFGGM